MRAYGSEEVAHRSDTSHEIRHRLFFDISLSTICRASALNAIRRQDFRGRARLHCRLPITLEYLDPLDKA